MVWVVWLGRNLYVHTCTKNMKIKKKHVRVKIWSGGLIRTKLVCTYMHTYVRACMHTHMHTYIRITRMHTYIRITRMHTYIRIYVYTYYTHAYVYTYYIQSFSISTQAKTMTLAVYDSDDFGIISNASKEYMGSFRCVANVVPMWCQCVANVLLTCC
jgi:hypothetical protein